MPANYDNSAWFYDSLSWLIYGNTLINAQRYLLQFVPADANILIAGGGTGKILEHIAQKHPSRLNITYAEISAKMIKRSKKRYTGNNQVLFLNNAVEDILFPRQFDVIITPFLLDNFNGQKLESIFTHLDNALVNGGLWLNADFELTGKWWQKILVKSMFTFFRIVCRLEASQLPDIKKLFAARNYQCLGRQTYYGDFIVSAAYQKSTIRYPSYENL